MMVVMMSMMMVVMMSMMMVVMMRPTCHKNREDDYKKVNIANVIAKMAALDNEFPPSLILSRIV